MPKGISKLLFKKLLKYYDEDVVMGAGLRIRRMAKAVDELPPTKRVQRIAEIFNHFRSPDKETVLTPWRVVNLHMSDMLGGYCFYDESFAQPNGLLDEPRMVERGDVTANLLLNADVKILEMNSKSGLYPLYIAYSIYAMRLPKREESLPLEQTQALWKEAVSDSVFVLCKTKMARSITIRTLAGYTGMAVNAIYLPKLLEWMEGEKRQRLANKLRNPKIWGKEGDKMKFDAIVGNPPYQQNDGGNKASAVPIYHYFMDMAKVVDPQYISMIMPARWYSGGRGLDAFRATMLNDSRIEKLVDYTDSNDCFTGVDIAGGICYFLWNKEYQDDCTVINVFNGNRYEAKRPLNWGDIFIRYSQALSIIRKVKDTETVFLSSSVSSQKPFGLRTYVTPTEEGDILLRYNKGTGAFKRELVTSGLAWIDKWKIIMSCLTYDHAGRTDKDGKRRIFSITEILTPQTVCTETYIVIDTFETEQEAVNMLSYLKTKFVRFLVAQVATTQHISKSSFCYVPMQDFSKPWTDAELYEKYALNKDEISFIENMIKPME